MNIILQVKNIKCGGCANTISTKVMVFEGVTDVAVDIETGKVCIQGDEDKRSDYATGLTKLGYPEAGSVQGLKSAGARAKSFVSCAVGRVSD
jgi:copper chaperone